MDTITEKQTIEDHLKNQLQRDFNNLWLYSGDYSLDYNFDNKINLWTEISEENYYDQLECLPPLKFNGRNFLIMEALTGNFHACLMKVNNRYLENMLINSWLTIQNLKMKCSNFWNLKNLF